MATQDQNTQPKKTEAKDAPELSREDAAKLVAREVPELDKDKKLTGKMKQIPVRPDELLAWKDYGDHVMVVTIDGKKLRGEK